MGMFTPQTSQQNDAITKALTLITRVSLAAAVALLPVVFIPLTSVPLIGGKVLITALLLGVIFVIGSLLLLRVGTFTIPNSATVGAGWLVVAALLVSAGLSGDVGDSVRVIGTSGFSAGVAALCFAMLTIAAAAACNVRSATWAVFGLFATSCLLLLWHAARLLTGSDLSFGLFASATSSPLGGWLDVSILAAGVTLGIFLLAAQSTLAAWLRWSAGVVLVAAILLLFAVNNTILWILLGIVSLTIVVRTITQRQHSTTPSLLSGGEHSNGTLLVFAGIVFVASIMVLFAGNSLQDQFTPLQDTPFVEVRPSVAASLDLVTNVWSEDVLTGVGPARFADAWRVHKANAINQTIFWNTDFNTGHSFILTQAVESGLLGLAAWLLFFGLLLLSGLRTFIFSSGTPKDIRHKVAFTSFVLAAFVWSTVFYMNPGISLLLLAAALTGLYIGLSLDIRPRHVSTVSLLHNQKLGFLVVAVTVVGIILAIWVLQLMTEQLIATSARNQALSNNTSVEAISRQLSDSFVRYSDDTTARASALLQLRQMQALMNIQEPTPEQQQAFQSAVVNAVNAATVAAEVDPTDPRNWYMQVQVYATLARVGVEDALARAETALASARALDPKSPQPDYLAAQLAMLRDDSATAREFATAAIQRKRDYTPALLLLAQIEINDGNVAEAITVTESVLSFEPNNAARWYQLGILYRANEQTDQALAALSRAIEIDADYANALYIRGVALAEQGETEAALRDLQRVQELNPDNQQVAQLIASVEAGPVEVPTASTTVEALPDEETERNPESISEAAQETDLITTTNNPSNSVETEAE